MEGPEEFMGSSDHTPVVKGKRTKRQRTLSPFGAVMTSSSSSGGGGGGRGDYCSISSPTSSEEVMESTEEEEDMANCLILLAQGLGPRKIEDGGAGEKFISPSFTEMAATTAGGGKAGFYVYECKTCNRTFPSFQALGGHRASHKKPKAVVEEKKVPAVSVAVAAASWDDDYYEDGQFSKISPPLSLQIGNNKALHSSNKSKVHECSICGSEFSSGQALGGHMRRHRSNTSSRINMSMETRKLDPDDHHKKEAAAVAARNILPLDLNLPAPEDEVHHHRDSKFQFTSNQQHLVFSAPALVDCHY